MFFKISELLKCEYFLTSLLLYDSKPKIFRLWNKQDILGHLGLWETLIDIFFNQSDIYRTEKKELTD